VDEQGQHWNWKDGSADWNDSDGAAGTTPLINQRDSGAPMTVPHTLKELGNTQNAVEMISAPANSLLVSEAVPLFRGCNNQEIRLQDRRKPIHR